MVAKSATRLSVPIGLNPRKGAQSESGEVASCLESPDVVKFARRFPSTKHESLLPD
jgi:hypothetical protein